MVASVGSGGTIGGSLVGGGWYTDEDGVRGTGYGASEGIAGGSNGRLVGAAHS